MIDPKIIEELIGCVEVAENESCISVSMKRQLIEFLNKLRTAKVKFSKEKE